MTPDSCIVPLSTKVINLTYLFFVINSYLFLLKSRVFFFLQRHPPPPKKKDPEYSGSSFISLEAVPQSYLRG